MLNDLVRRPCAVARHRSTLFGVHLDEYVSSLKSQGYRHSVIQKYLFVITRFGKYLMRRRIRQLDGICDDAVVGFLKREKRRLLGSSHRTRQVAVIHRVIEAFLQYLGVFSPDSNDEPPPGLIGEFHRWLAVDRGLQPITIEGYRRYLGQLLEHIRSDGSAESLSGLTARDIDAFVIIAGRRYGRRSMSHACTAIRAFLRFLLLRNVIGLDLAPTVIMPRFYALERLPCSLPWETIQRVLNSVVQACH